MTQAQEAPTRWDLWWQAVRGSAGRADGGTGPGATLAGRCGSMLAALAALAALAVPAGELTWLARRGPFRAAAALC